MDERRVDPEDGQAYTWEELRQFYKGKYKNKDIDAYWEECKIAKNKKAKGSDKKGGTASKAESQPKAKAKAKVKVKAVKVKKEKRKRVSILGGAFDPPTLNHLLGAAEVVHSDEADEVWLVPCGPRPDKPNLSPVLHRYIMTQLSVNTSFSPAMPIHVSDVEVQEEEAFATYDLLRKLREKHPDTDFSFVIGTDWLQPGADLRQWTSKCPETGGQIVTGDKLVSEFDFLVIHRPGYDVDDIASYGPRMRALHMPEGVSLMEGSLSSTEVRKRADVSFRASSSIQLIEGLVAPSCLSYITRHGLYLPKVEEEYVTKPRRSLSASHESLARDASQKKKRVAVFGGAFDPPTHSHMIGLAEILHSGMADEALMVPCGPRPDKPKLRHPLVRYCMCELAVNSSFSPSMPVRASPLEVFEPEALATYDSLCKLREQEPNSSFMFVIGSDWLQPGADLRTWTSKCPDTGAEIVTGDKLLSEFDFIVIKRPGYEVEDIKQFGPRMQWMEMPNNMKAINSNLSSTEVRKRADISYTQREGKLQLLDGLVPTGVYNYIKRENVYKPSEAAIVRRKGR